MPKVVYPPKSDLRLHVNYPYAMLVKQLSAFSWNVERQALTLKEALNWHPHPCRGKKIHKYAIRIARQTRSGSCTAIYAWCGDHWKRI